MNSLFIVCLLFSVWGGDCQPRRSGPVKSSEDQRLWHFHIGSDLNALEYLNDEGYIQGFHPDLINEVCRMAGKKCLYSVDDYDKCREVKNGVELPGIGLLAGWYDACAGYYPTPERNNSFGFTTGFIKRTKIALHVLNSSTITTVNNVTGWNIGLMKGYAMNDRCLARQSAIFGVNPPTYVPHLFTSHGEMVESLKRGELDAIVTEVAPEYWTKAGIKATSPDFYCATGGLGMMTRYGSPLVSWWDSAFEEFASSGQFKDFCAKQIIKHGHRGNIACID